MANKFDIDPALVRKLSDLLGETGLSEIEYENETEPKNENGAQQTGTGTG